MENSPATPLPTPIPQPASADLLSTSRAGGKISSNRDIAVVQADYMALANDLEQAQSLAASLEIELSGKTNELANFKHIWERTQTDLVKLEHDIEDLRKERHALANQVQRGQAFEFQYEKLKKGFLELQQRQQTLEAELSAERAAHASARLELADLKEAVGKTTGKPAAAVGNDPELREALLALKTKLDRVLATPPFKAGETASTDGARGPQIEIAYE